MTGLLGLPVDAPLTDRARAGAWLTEWVDIPAAPGDSRADRAVGIAAVCAVLARMSGESVVRCAVPGIGAFALTVGRDATGADLVSQAAAALAAPGDDAENVSIRIGFAAQPPAGPCDLSVSLTTGADGGPSSVGVSGPTGSFLAETLRRIAGSIARVYARLGDPDRRDEPVSMLPMLSDEDRVRLVDEFNDTAVPITRRPAHQIIAERCAENPAAPAIAGDGYTLTYGELDALARALEQDLDTAGVAPGDLVHLLLPRGPELVVAWLAVLRVGAVCVPLDPDYPAARLSQLIGDSKARVLVRADTTGPVPHPERAHPIDLDDLRRRSADDRTGERAAHDPETPAYVIHTSGSTGVPKGAIIEHRGLTNLLEATATQFGLGPGRRCLVAASPAFDVSVWEILAPLAAGATVVPYTGEHLTAQALSAFVSTHRVDTVFLLASLLARLDPDDFPGLHTVVTGGESFTAQLVDRWQPGRDLIYVYGPTEATVFQSWHHCFAGSAVPPPTIGRPMANLRFHVLDAWGAPVPQGAVGELYIGGVGPGLGYLGMPEESARVFLPDPAGGRLYRTGDLASFRPDGLLDFRGRVDRQVKIRGFRVEPGEVEARLCALPGVKAAAVVVHTAEAGADPFLVAYVIAEAGVGTDDDTGIDTVALRDRLGELLPHQLIPAAIVPLAEFPRTPNGKIDRPLLAGLPLPTRSPRPAALPDGDAQTARLVEAVRCRFADALGEDAGPDDDFFALGGQSLAAAGLAATLSRTFGVRVSVRDIFTRPTAALLAQRVRGLIEQARQRGPEPIAAPAPPPVDQDAHAADGLPLSPWQHWLWLHAQTLAPDSSAYNVPLLLRCAGSVDPARLSAAVLALQLRHPLLRARVVTRRGEPRLAIDDEPVEPRIVEQSPDSLGEAVQQYSDAAFTLDGGRLFRAVCLVPSDGAAPSLVLVAHHLISDGPSLETMSADLVRLYEGDDPGPVPPPAPLVPSRAEQDADLAYWRGRLTPAPQPLALPVDHPRGGPPGVRSAVVTARIDDDVVQAARRAAGPAPASLFATLTGAVAAVLRSVTGAAEVTLGTAVDLRPRLDADGAVGCLVNSVALRIPLRPQSSYAEIIAVIVGEVAGAVDHCLCPFDGVAERLAPSRAVHRSPFFDVWVTAYDEIDVAGPAGFGLAGGPVTPASGLFDLSFMFRRGRDGTTLILQYDSTLYEPDTARSLGERVGKALAAAAEDAGGPVGDWDLRTEHERAVVERPLFAGFRIDPR